MKIAVCEDEKIFSDILCERIKKYFSTRGETAEIKTYSDGKPLTEDIKNGERFEIVFLDIQLEESDGMEQAAEIRKYDTSADIVFVTSLQDRAVEGYAVSAFDYIVKSSVDSRLESVLDRFVKKYTTEVVSLPLSGGETKIVHVTEILWFESEGRGTRVGFTSGESVVLTSAVGKIAVLIPYEQFTEVHKSIFVQTKLIKNIGNDTVEMKNGKTFPLSRRKRKDVMTAVMDAVRGSVR